MRCYSDFPWPYHCYQTSSIVAHYVFSSTRVCLKMRSLWSLWSLMPINVGTAKGQKVTLCYLKGHFSKSERSLFSICLSMPIQFQLHDASCHHIMQLDAPSIHVAPAHPICCPLCFLRARVNLSAKNLSTSGNAPIGEKRATNPGTS